ncbi:MAG: hypothetical protein ABSB35_08220 [Bryobacteraceae bacterium]|jgi:uncharacterized membrane protein YccC
MSEAGTSRRRSEPSLDEQFARLFDVAEPDPPPVVPARTPKPAAVRVAVKAALGLLLGVAVGILFLVIAVVVFALRPR